MSERNEIKLKNQEYKVLFIYGQWLKGYDGGVEHLEMNYAIWLREVGIFPDALAVFSTPSKKFYSIFKECNGCVWELGLSLSHSNTVQLLSIFYHVYCFLKRHRYTVVHINSGAVLFVFPVLLAAFLNKIKVRIAHSHNTDKSKHIITFYIKKCFRFFNGFLASDYFTCSKDAALSLFSDSLVEQEHIVQINNGVNTKLFCFNPSIRLKMRNSLGLENKFVIGHIGSIDQRKNQSFLLDVFANLREQCDNVFLVLCGEGELKEKIQQKARILGIEPFVLFLGYRSDISDIMNALDIFLLPSLHEGLPIVAIEAQSTGLPCILSDTITKEVKLLDKVTFLPISEGPDVWVEKILEYKNTVVRRDCTTDIVAAKYDQESTKHQLQSFYLSKTW